MSADARTGSPKGAVEGLVTDAVTGGPAALTQHEFWNDYAGPGWVEHADALEQINEVVGLAAVEAAALRPGMRVLDVGCGTGGTAFARTWSGCRSPSRWTSPTRGCA